MRQLVIGILLVASTFAQNPVVRGYAGVGYVIPSGNVATATSLATIPTPCSANQFAYAIAASGNLTCSPITLPTQSNNTILGNISGSSAAPIGLTPTQVTALLNQFSSTLQGLVPSSGGGTINFLRADGSFAPPPGGTPGGTSGQVQFNSAGSFGGFTLGGDGTLNTSTGTITITKTNGVSFSTMATSDSASNLLTGTLPSGRLPNPSASTLGGVQSKTAVSNEFLTTVSTLGVFSSARPTCSNLGDSGTGCSATLSTIATTGSASDLGTGTIPNARLVSLPNSVLANSSVTVNGSGCLGNAGSISLGSTGTVTSGNCANVTTANTYTNVVAPSSPSAGSVSTYTDSTDLRFHDKNSAGTVGTTVVPITCTNQIMTILSNAGLFTCSTITSAFTSGTFTATAHNILSPTHGDTSAASAVRGDGFFAIGSTPTWQRLAHPSVTGGYFKWNGTDIIASTMAAAGTGSCTNQVVTTENADAGPSCNTVTSAMVDATVKGYSSTNTTANAMASAATDTQIVEVALAAGVLNTASKVSQLFSTGTWTVGTTQTPTWNLKIKLCTVSGCGSGTVLTLASWTSAASTASTTQTWIVDASIGTSATGASGTLLVHGIADLPVGATANTVFSGLHDVNTAVSSTIDLTAALFLNVTANVSTQSGTKNSLTYHTVKVIL